MFNQTRPFLVGWGGHPLLQKCLQCFLFLRLQASSIHQSCCYIDLRVCLFIAESPSSSFYVWHYAHRLPEVDSKNQRVG
uniref:Putative secreted protein n=1 Tax=Panstrongylus lignarius TaxID=156445 RepID=A0A224XT33_9HEMI